MKKNNSFKNEVKLLLKIIILFLLLFSTSIAVQAQNSSNNLVNIYFFHSKDCSHCKSESQLLDKLESKYSNVNIYRYEISEFDNNEKRKYVEELYDVKTHGVPLTVIGDSVYSGYSEEKSSIQFIKTIEYYSRYGYEDKIGERLQISTLPNFNQITNRPTLEEFMDNYANYNLFGPFYTNDFDISINSYLLGIKSQCNVIKIGSIIIFLLLLFKIKDKKIQITTSFSYLITLFLWTINMVLENKILNIILILILVSKIIIDLKTKKKNNSQTFLLVLLAITTSISERIFYPDALQIFKKIISLHNLSNLETIICYSNYILIIFFFDIIVILLLLVLVKIIIKILGQKKFKVKTKIM